MTDLNQDNIKKVIAELRKGPVGWTDLKDATKIQDKTLARILEGYLHYWGLAEKTNDEKWAWYEHVKIIRSVEEYKIFLEHSEKLILGIKSLVYNVEKLGGDELVKNFAGVNTREKYVKDACRVELDRGVLDELEARFVEHLKTGYNVLFNKNMKLRELEDAYSKEDKGLRKEIIKELKEPICISVHSSSEKAFRDNDVSSEGIIFSSEGKYRNIDNVLVSDLVASLKMSSQGEFKYDKEKQDFNWRIGGSWRSTTIAHGVSEEEAEEIKRVIQKVLAEKRSIEKVDKLKEHIKKVYKLRSEIGDELRRIEANIRAGELLEGTCNVCRTLNLEEPLKK